jgi:DNA polymerase III epsilon subunit-like protein
VPPDLVGTDVSTLNELTDRQKAILLARQILSQPFVIFDTETTGLDSAAEIVEIACVGSSGEVLLNSLVLPTTPVPPDAYAIHGIGNQTLVGAPSMPALLPRITSVFQGKAVGSYNFAFDSKLLLQSLRARGMAPPGEWSQLKPFCVMEMYAQYWGERHDYFGSYTWQSLGNALVQCGLRAKGRPHRALSDAWAALDVLLHVADTPFEA